MRRFVLHWLSLGVAQAVGFLLVSTVLLLLNSTLVSSLFQVALDQFSRYTANQRINQAVLFITPVLMLVLEYWLYDRILDGLFPISTLAPESPDNHRPRG